MPLLRDAIYLQTNCFEKNYQKTSGEKLLLSAWKNTRESSNRVFVPEIEAAIRPPIIIRRESHSRRVLSNHFRRVVHPAQRWIIKRYKVSSTVLRLSLSLSLEVAVPLCQWSVADKYSWAVAVTPLSFPIRATFAVYFARGGWGNRDKMVERTWRRGGRRHTFMVVAVTAMLMHPLDAPNTRADLAPLGGGTWLRGSGIVRSSPRGGSMIRFEESQRGGNYVVVRE